MLRFVDAEYYRKGESGWEGLEMDLAVIVDILYVIDIQSYTVLNEGGELGWLFVNIKSGKEQCSSISKEGELIECQVLVYGRLNFYNEGK